MLLLFCSALVVDRSGMVGWSRKSYLRPATIASFCSWFYCFFLTNIDILENLSYAIYKHIHIHEEFTIHYWAMCD